MNYYFAASGSLVNTGTASTAAWPVSKLATFVPVSGDVIHCNCNDHFPPYAAVSGVTYTSYGTGNLPVISGFETLSGWTSFGNGIYYATDANLGGNVYNVTLNGGIATLGRFPKTGYRTYTAHNANLSITDLTLPDNPSYVGAQVVIKKLHYIIDVGTITVQASGVISYSGTSTQLPQNNYGYFLQNSPLFLSQLGEWSYDANTKRIYMYFGTADPNSFVVKASRYDIVANYSGKTGCITNNLAFEGANATACVRGSGGSNNTFDLCQILNSGADGFFFSTATGISITDSNVQNCMNNGTIMLYTNGSKINNNTGSENGNIAGRNQNGFGVSGFGSGNGISLGTNSNTTDFNNQCLNNSIINSGYIGIYINGGSYTCTGNYVNGATLIKDDGAGIYTWTGNTAIVYGQRTISNNTVVNCPGCQDGTDGLFGNEGNGIYCDDNSSNLTVSGNTVAHCGNYALLLHNSHEVTISNNKFFDAANCLIAILHDNAAIVTPANLNISGNQLYSLTTSQLMIYFRSTAGNSSAGDITTWGTATNNQYGAFHNTAALFRIQLPASNTTVNFSAWQSATGKDASPSAFTNLSAYLTKYLFIYNETQANKPFTLSGVYKDILNNSYSSGSVTLTPSQSLMLLQTATALVPNISYTPSTKIFTLNQVITALSPANTGGAATSWSISPGLPTGLNFNTSTGIITGTPTVLSAATSYTVSAINGAGTGNTTINLTVNPTLPAFSYSPSADILILNQAIAPITPTNTGGTPVSYAISPGLPTGLSFNTSTGVITGTPTVLSANTAYTITATNAAGATPTILNLTVNPLPPVISYSPASEIYIIGSAITPISPSNTGGTVVSYAISPTLPLGLSFNTSTGAITGTPTVVSTLKAYTITATNTGGSGQTTLNITVNITAPSISYTPSSNVYTFGVAITSLIPANTGGAATSYGISPALPAGLILDTVTGIITGTPTALHTNSSFTVTATNVTGSSNTTISITVNAKVPALSYLPSSHIYTQNVAIVAIGPTNTGGIPVSYAVSPGLPTGLSLNTSSGMISGTPTALIAATAYTITATNTGGSAATILTLSVIAAVPVTNVIKKKRIRY